jgi:hypothetical protein
LLDVALKVVSWNALVAEDSGIAQRSREAIPDAIGVGIPPCDLPARVAQSLKLSDNLWIRGCYYGTGSRTVGKPKS